MILDSLKNAGLYLSLNPLFKQAFDFVENNDISAFEPGKTIIDSDKLFISVMEIDGKTPETAKLETHNKYIDIQIVLEGNETMGWLDIDNCKTAVD